MIISPERERIKKTYRGYSLFKSRLTGMDREDPGTVGLYNKYA